MKVLLKKKFHLNGHTIGFYPQKFEQHNFVLNNSTVKSAVNEFVNTETYTNTTVQQVAVCNRPFARWRHFTTTTRILQGIAFLCKLRLLFIKPH